jgi:hypothetical protein
MPVSGAPVVLQADCTFFSINMARSPQLASLFWQIEAALVFAPSIRQLAGNVVSRLRDISRARGVADGRFHALHVRVEKDWVEHCRIWEMPGMRDNCMSNTEQLDRCGVGGAGVKRQLRGGVDVREADGVAKNVQGREKRHVVTRTRLGAQHRPKTGPHASCNPRPRLFVPSQSAAHRGRAHGAAAVCGGRADGAHAGLDAGAVDAGRQRLGISALL